VLNDAFEDKDKSPELSAMHKVVSKKALPHMPSKTPIKLQDPFELNRNIAANLPPKEVESFQLHCSAAFKACQNEDGKLLDILKAKVEGENEHEGGEGNDDQQDDSFNNISIKFHSEYEERLRPLSSNEEEDLGELFVSVAKEIVIKALKVGLAFQVEKSDREEEENAIKDPGFSMAEARDALWTAICSPIGDKAKKRGLKRTQSEDGEKCVTKQSLESEAYSVKSERDTWTKRRLIEDIMSEELKRVPDPFEREALITKNLHLFPSSASFAVFFGRDSRNLIVKVKGKQGKKKWKQVAHFFSTFLPKIVAQVIRESHVDLNDLRHPKAQ